LTTDAFSTIWQPPAFRKTRLLDIGIVPVFDTPEHLAQYLTDQRENGAKLIRDSGFEPR
jgi:tripartite-type tricarboxylate transporter receptor subunit TctC